MRTKLHSVWEKACQSGVYWQPKMKNKAAQSLGALGGAKTSAAKTKANGEKIRQFWADVRAGKKPKPQRKKRKP